MNPTMRTGSPGYAIELTIWSKARRVANTPKVCTNGIWPLRDSAPARLIMFASAMPPWMNRSGIFSWKRSTSHCRVRSPDRHRISSRCSATSTRALPYGLTTVGYGGLRKACLQFGDRVAGEFRRELYEVPVRVRRQDAQSPPGGGPGDDHARPVTAGGRCERGAERADVVAVDVIGVPPERFPFGRYRFQGGDGADRPVDLRVVRV